MVDTISYPNPWLLLTDPWRPPCWRWLLAQAAVAHSWVFPDACCDPWLARTVDFHRRSKAKRTVAKHSAMSRALALYQDNQWPRWELEARVLAGQSPLAISCTMQLRPGVIRAYEACFFDVRDRLRYRGYIVHVVLGDRYHAGMKLTDVDLLLKRHAYLDGPVLLEKVLRFLREPLALDTNLTTLGEAARRERREFLLFRLGQLGQTLPINRTTLRLAALLRGAADQLAGATQGRCQEITKLALPVQSPVCRVVRRPQVEVVRDRAPMQAVEQLRCPPDPCVRKLDVIRHRMQRQRRLVVAR